MGLGTAVYEDRQLCLSLNKSRWGIIQGCEIYWEGKYE